MPTFLTSLRSNNREGSAMTIETHAAIIDRPTFGPLIKTSDAAALLACTTRKITDMCRKGEIKAVKVGSDWRINTSAFLDQFGI